MAKITFRAPGDDLDIQRTATLVPVGQKVTDAWLTIKDDPEDDDVDALVQKHITTTNSADGQVTDADDSDGEATLLFRLQPSDTLAIGALSRYYDIQVKTDAGQIYTGEFGSIRADHPNVTQSTS